MRKENEHSTPTLIWGMSMRLKEIVVPWHPCESTWELERWGRVGNGQELRFDKVRHPEKSLQKQLVSYSSVRLSKNYH